MASPGPPGPRAPDAGGKRPPSAPPRLVTAPGPPRERQRRARSPLAPSPQRCPPRGRPAPPDGGPEAASFRAIAASSAAAAGGSEPGPPRVRRRAAEGSKVRPRAADAEEEPARPNPRRHRPDAAAEPPKRNSRRRRSDEAVDRNPRRRRGSPGPGPSPSPSPDPASEADADVDEVSAAVHRLSTDDEPDDEVVPAPAPAAAAAAPFEPGSRLFVVCGRNAPEALVRAVFEPHGPASPFWLVRDKGCGFVQFPTAAEAQRVAAALHGHVIAPQFAPLKVVVAEDRGAQPAPAPAPAAPAPAPAPAPEAAEPEDWPPGSRLFVVWPTPAMAEPVGETQLAAHFRPFPGLEYVRVIQSRQASSRAVIAFAKFSSAAEAAAAIHRLHGAPVAPGATVRAKVMVAEPKRKRAHVESAAPPGPMPALLPPPPPGPYDFAPPPPGPYDFAPPPPPQHYPGAPPMHPMHPMPMHAMHHAMPMHPVPVPMPMHPAPMPPPPPPPQQQQHPPPAEPPRRLFVVCDKRASHDDLRRLFARVGSLEYVDLKTDRGTGRSRGFAYVGFATPEAAAAARDAFAGHELPAGSGRFLKVMFAEPRQPSRQRGGGGGGGGGAGGGGREVEALRDGLGRLSAGAESPTQRPGKARRWMGVAGAAGAGAPAPAAAAPDGSLLDVVVSPPMGSEQEVAELFAQVSGLEFVSFAPHSAAGVVKFCTPAAAALAVRCFDGTAVRGHSIRASVAGAVGAVGVGGVGMGGVGGVGGVGGGGAEGAPGKRSRR